MNLLEGALSGTSVSIGSYSINIDPAAASKATGNRIVVGVRPEHLEVSNDGISMTVNLVEELGSDEFLYGTIDDDGAKDITVRVASDSNIRRGDKIKVKPTSMHFFDATEEGPRLN
jgi:multiple sugar transport system ATP-binding protein